MTGTRIDDLGHWAWEPWRDAAQCRNADPELFFGQPGEGPAARRMRVTACKKLCRQCMVRLDCLRFAYENGETSGVWGGLTGEERAQRLIVARQRRAGGLRKAS